MSNRLDPIYWYYGKVGGYKDTIYHRCAGVCIVEEIKEETASEGWAQIIEMKSLAADVHNPTPEEVALFELEFGIAYPPIKKILLREALKVTQRVRELK